VLVFKWLEGDIVSMSKYEIVSIEGEERGKSRFTESFTLGLTDKLNLKNMRGKFWFVPPRGTIVAHRHRVQEEIYYQIKGPGKMLIEKEVIEVPEGSIVSVPPETWRQVINDTNTEHIWLIIGSPAVDKDGIRE